MVRNSTMTRALKDYIAIAGEDTIDELKFLARYLKGRKIQHISASRNTGGLAQMMGRIVPLMDELGVDVEWDSVEGDGIFQSVNQKFLQAVYGKPEIITDSDFDVYIEAAHEYTAKTKIRGELVIAHGFEPLALIQNKKKFKDKKWVWWCHTDASAPDERVWDFMSTFIEGYDAACFSSPKFIHSLNLPKFLICPAIDPLSSKNRDMTVSEIEQVLRKYGIHADKPIILQVARFDYLKDNQGMIEAFKLVKKYVDAQLVLAGTTPQPGDIEGERVLGDLREKAVGVDDVHILAVSPETNDIDINALQRAAAVVAQKSVKEGFGLSVTEALWKMKPVVASAVGGIPLQIKNKYSGLLCHSIEGAALQIRQFLNNQAFAKRLAHNGMLHIKHNFLITRLIREQMLLAISMFHEGDIINL